MKKINSIVVAILIITAAYSGVHASTQSQSTSNPHIVSFTPDKGKFKAPTIKDATYNRNTKTASFTAQSPTVTRHFNFTNVVEVAPKGKVPTNLELIGSYGTKTLYGKRGNYQAANTSNNSSILNFIPDTTKFTASTIKDAVYDRNTKTASFNTPSSTVTRYFNFTDVVEVAPNGKVPTNLELIGSYGTTKLYGKISVNDIFNFTPNKAKFITLDVTQATYNPNAKTAKIITQTYSMTTYYDVTNVVEVQPKAPAPATLEFIGYYDNINLYGKITVTEVFTYGHAH